MNFIQNINPVLKFLFAFLIFSIGNVLPALAQDDLPDEEVEVIKNFDARLLDADMLEVDPTLPPSNPNVTPQNYKVETKTVPVQYLPPKIRPLALKRDRPAEVFNGYLKAGAGLPNSLFGEAGYSIFRDKQFDFNLHAKHHSANNNRNIENQQFSNNFIKTSGSYYFSEGFAVAGRLGWEKDVLRYYGYNFDERFDSLSFTSGQTRQRFNIFDIGASIFNGVQNIGDVNYSADLDLYTMNDAFAARERGFKLDLNLTKWFSEKHPLSITVVTDLTSFRDSTSQNLNNFYLQPNFTYVNDLFRVKVGANIVTNNDEYSFFPDIEATVPILGSRFTTFIGINGNLQKNTLRSLTDYNPFLATRADLDLRNTRFLDYFGGIKGILGGFEYLGRVGFKSVDDLALFNANYAGIAETVVPYDFLTLYDNGNIFYINGSITTPELKGITLIGSINSSVYSLDNQERPWHLPSLTVNGSVVYKLLEGKAKARASIFIENGVPFQTEAGDAETLSGLLDLSVGAEYQIVKNFGVWLDVYNLANNRRQRWLNYPTFGINVLLGASVRF